MPCASCAMTSPSVLASTVPESSGTRARRRSSSWSTAGSTVILGLSFSSEVRASPQGPQCGADAFEQDFIGAGVDRRRISGYLLGQLGAGFAPGQPRGAVHGSVIGG